MFRRSDEGGTEKAKEEAALQAALQLSVEERERGKREAIEACSPEQLLLINCYRGGSFFACAEARTAFWKCFRRERGFDRTLANQLATRRGASESRPG